MTDDMNQSKRKPWTTDPDVVKQIWGENAQAALGTKTAVDRLVNQKGSLWPTEQELQAFSANALPDTQTFGRSPLTPAEDVVKPAQHTSILPPLVRKTDGMQDLIDSALGLKEAKGKAVSKKQDIQLVDEGEEPDVDEDGNPDDDLYEDQEEEDEEEPSAEAGRNPEEKAKKGKGKGKGKKTKEAAPYQEIFIPVTSIETRMKEARIRMQEVIDRNRR